MLRIPLEQKELNPHTDLLMIRRHSFAAITRSCKLHLSIISLSNSSIYFESSACAKFSDRDPVTKFCCNYMRLQIANCTWASSAFPTAQSTLPARPVLNSQIVFPLSFPLLGLPLVYTPAYLLLIWFLGRSWLSQIEKSSKPSGFPVKWITGDLSQLEGLDVRISVLHQNMSGLRLLAVRGWWTLWSLGSVNIDILWPCQGPL